MQNKTSANLHNLEMEQIVYKRVNIPLKFIRFNKK